MQFWKLQDLGDAEPYGVAAKDDQGLARLFVPGQGLVDIPSVARFTSWGEPGAYPISEAEAHALMQQGVGAMTADAVDSLKGDAPTIPVDVGE